MRPIQIALSDKATIIQMKYIIADFIEQFNNVQSGKLWMGPNYKRMLEDINEHSAFIRPIPDLHSVAEIISHLTLWREETILKIKTGTGSKTDDCEENWLNNIHLKKLGWGYIKQEYDNSSKELIDLLKSKDDPFLDEYYYDTDFKGNYKYSFVINGMLHHDLYHLGQLGIVLKYLRKVKS